MIEMKNNNGKKYNRFTPKVSFSDEEIMMGLDNLINTDKNIYEYMGLLLLKLKFKDEDTILFNGYDKRDSSFSCIVNDKEYVGIKFNDKEIIVSNNDREYGYTYIPCEKKELGVDVYLNRYTFKYSDGVLLTRYCSRDSVRYISVVDNRQLEVKINKPLDIKLPLYDNNGRYAKYEIDNEDKLRDYLCNFNKDINLSNFYEYISNNCVDDINKYPLVSLTLSKFDDNYNLIEMDLVSFLYGEIDRFGFIDNKKTIFIHKDGSYLYENYNEEESSKMIVNYNEKDKMYNVSFTIDGNKTTKYRDELSIIDSEVEDVKKLTKSLFTKKR